MGTGECDQQSGLVNQLPQQMVSREADIRKCESTNDVLCRQAVCDSEYDQEFVLGNQSWLRDVSKARSSTRGEGDLLHDLGQHEAGTSHTHAAYEAAGVQQQSKNLDASLRQLHAFANNSRMAYVAKRGDGECTNNTPLAEGSSLSAACTHSSAVEYHEAEIGQDQQAVSEVSSDTDSGCDPVGSDDWHERKSEHQQHESQ